MNTQKLVLIIKGSIDKIILVLFALLLLAMFMFYSKEQQTIPEEISPPQPPPPETLIDDDILEMIKEYFLNDEVSIENNPDAMVLINQNLFEYKAVRDVEAIRSDATLKYKEALELYKKGELTAARKMCDRALLIYPDHVQARALRQQIIKDEEKQKEEQKEAQ